jgi:chromosome segregation ATPase
VSAVSDVNSLEDTLRAMWEKARAAAELISQLRSDRQVLGERVSELQKEVASLRSELQGREQELKRVRGENLQLLNGNNHELLSAEEKEHIKNRIRELLAKLNSYL